LIFTRKLVEDIEVFFFGEEIKFIDTVFFLDARLNYGIPLVVDNLVELFGRQAQQVSNLVWQ